MPKSYVKKAEENLFEIGLAAVVVVIGAWGASATVLDAETTSSDGLVAEYRFDTGAGDTAYDTSGNNDGTIEGASWSEGIEGRSLSFDGQNDEVNTDINVDQSSDGRSYTFCAWSKLDSTGGGTQQIISSDSGGFDWSILKNKNKAEFELFTGSGVLSSGVSTDTEWHHICGVFDNINDKAELYVDGRLAGTSQLGYDTSSSKINIGSNPCCGEHWNGEIDNSLIYSKALNHSQIKSLYNSGSWRIGTDVEEDVPSKVLDISFQHQNSTALFDTSGNENHAYPQNGARQETAVNCKVGRCYRFDGTDDYLEVPNEATVEGKNGLTMSAWVYTNSLQAGYPGIVVAQNGANQVGIFQHDGRFYYEIGTNDDSQNRIVSGEPVDVGEWTHVSLVFNGSSQTMTEYINGRATGRTQATSTGTTDTDFSNLNIGRWQGGPDNFHGLIDQVKIHDKALTQDQIARETNGLSADGAVLDLRFNRDGGELVEDSSGRNNHGRLEPSETAGPSRVQGVTGNALHLDGENDYADIGNQGSLNFEPGDSFSYSVWFKPEDYSDIESGYVWVQHERSYFIQRKSNDMNLTSNIGGSGTPFNKKPEPGEWNHAILTYRDGTLSLYYNGEQVNQASATAEDMTSSDLTVTTPRFGQNWYADGSVDKVKAYPYRLSSDSVQNIYEREKSAVKQGGDRADLENGLALSQTFNRVETCGQSDTITCPPGANGEISVDEGGEANHGELVNGVIQEDSQNCVRGSCVNLDGSDDQIEINDDSELRFKDGQGFSISSWVEADPSSIQDSDYETFLSKGSFDSPPVYGLQTTSDNDIRFFLKDSSGSDLILDGPNIEAGKFTHVTATYDGSQANLYVNGRKTSSSTNNLGDFKGSQNLFVGLHNRVGGPGKYQYWDGLVDQSRVYNRSLSDQEVWKLYTQGRDRESGMAGPLARYEFNKPTGTRNYPGKSCNQIYESRENPSSGTYYVDPDTDGKKVQKVYCDMGLRDDGWNLIYNYNHTGGNEPPATEGEWPLSHDALSHQDNLQRFGYDQQMIKEVRFRCETSNHNRVVHYVSKDSDTIQGVLDNSTTAGYRSIANSSYKLPEHSANLPDAAGSDTGESEPTPGLFGPRFPMYKGGEYHWSIGEPGGSGNRWECDDFPGDASQDTLHQIWIKSEGVTTIPDLEGEGTTGEVNGNPQIVSGRTGKAIEFDGSDDYVEVPNIGQDLNNANEFTISYRINYNQFVNYKVAYGNRPFWTEPYRDGNRGISIRIQDSSGNNYRLQSGHVLGSENKWYTITYTFNGTHLAAFRGAERVGILNTGDIDLSLPSKHYIGSYDDNNNFVNATMDDVRVYPYALDQDQIRRVANSGSVSVT